MSGLMPFEGSGESSLAPLEPSTTVVSYYETLRTTAASYLGSSFKATTTNTHRVTTTVWVTPTTFTLTTIGGTEDHQSTKSIPYLLPLWAWAALLLGIVVLVSLTTIWITLVVGWKKGKRRKRRDSEVNLNPRSASSCRNSNLWIDENDGQGQPVEDTRTHKASTSLRLPGGNSSTSTSNVGAGFPNAMYVKQHNDILKEMKAKSSLFLNERAGDGGTWSDCETRRGEIGMHTRGDRERYGTIGDSNKRVDVIATRVHKGHQDKPHSQTLPRSLHSHNVTDARLSHRLIHLQPATTSTFKRRTAGKKHARHNIINEHTPDTQFHATSDPAQIGPGDTATNYDILERRVNPCASGDPEFEINLDLTTGPSLGVEEVADVMNPFNYQNSPVDRDSPARGLELSGNVHALEPQININPLPPAPLMNRHDFDNYDVTTFSQYAFSTL